MYTRLTLSFLLVSDPESWDYNLVPTTSDSDKLFFERFNLTVGFPVPNIVLNAFCATLD